MNDLIKRAEPFAINKVVPVDIKTTTELVSLVHDLLEALRASSDGWLPISEAPRDKPFLAFCPKYYRNRLGGDFDVIDIVEHDTGAELGYSGAYSKHYDLPLNPTHYMLLPNPPHKPEGE